MNRSVVKFNFRIIMLTVFVCVSLIIPIWQSAVSNELERKINMQKAAISSITEKKMSVNLSIASKSTPEYLYEQALSQNISFNLVSSTSKVASK